MILFLFHAVIALLVAYIVLRSVYESGRRELLLPLGGILLVFLAHCLLSTSSCLECELTNPRCVVEIALFWVFTAWAVVGYLRKHP